MFCYCVVCLAVYLANCARLNPISSMAMAFKCRSSVCQMRPGQPFFLFIVAGAYAQPACVNGSGCCGTPVEVGIPDGDFEDPVLPTPPPVIATYFGGQTFGAWTVVSGSIDLLASAVYGGSNMTQIIDLNVFTSGTITNTLNNLQPGACYVIVLEYANSNLK